MHEIFTSALRHKIWFDLWGARQRTIQAILTIAIGAFAVGTVLSALQGVLQDTERNWSVTNAPAITMRVVPGVSSDLLNRLEQRPDLDAVDVQMESSIEWRSGPDQPWKPANLIARQDYSDQQLAVLTLEEGNWPNARLLGVERNFDLGVDDQVELRIDTRTTTQTINGVIYSRIGQPRTLGGSPNFYVTRERFTELTGQSAYQSLRATIQPYSIEAATAVAATLQSDLADLGYKTLPASTDRSFISNPSRPWFQELTDGIGFVLQTIGIITMLLSLLLIYNTVNAIITQQTAQIGELKAIGASQGQIICVYMAIVFVYGLAAALLSLPLSLLAANFLRNILVTRLGMTPGGFMIAPFPVLIQSLLCIVAPLLIALPPILRGARITVREAISSYGLSSTGNALDALLGKLRWVSRVIALAISNAFGNWQRLLLTQLALGGAGITLVAVLSTQATLSYASGQLFNEVYPFQIQLDFTESESLPRIEQISQHPTVRAIEIWRTSSPILQIQSSGTTLSRSIQLNGVPLPSASYQPQLREGRWLEPGDTYALAISEGVAKELNIHAGDWVRLQISSPRQNEIWASDQQWQVVGILIDPNIRNLSRMAIAPRDTVMQSLGGGFSGDRVQIQADLASPSAAPALADELRSYYTNLGVDVEVTKTDTIYERSNNQRTNTQVISTLLLFMSVIVAAIGGIALSGVLAISVLERRREIGVLRAIGATPSTIRTLFVSEGLILSWISWLLALACSYPLGMLLAQQVCNTIGISVVYQYSWFGVGLWFGLASLIGIMASLGPAQGAIRASIQESLSYE